MEMIKNGVENTFVLKYYPMLTQEDLNRIRAEIALEEIRNKI